MSVWRLPVLGRLSEISTWERTAVWQPWSAEREATRPRPALHLSADSIRPLFGSPLSIACSQRAGRSQQIARTVRFDANTGSMKFRHVRSKLRVYLLLSTLPLDLQVITNYRFILGKKSKPKFGVDSFTIKKQV